MKKHWFYRSGNRNRSKSNGFRDWATEMFEQASVSEIGQPKSLKKQWLYRSGNRTCRKSTGFTNIKAEDKFKNIWFDEHK